MGVKLGISHQRKNRKVFEKKVLRRSGPLDLRGRKWQDAGEDCTVRNFRTCTLH
jgi:hypothetical protein